MGTLFRMIILVVVGASVAGCTAERLAMDQRDLRNEVLGLLEDQVMDNLVRAFNDDVMLQLDYVEFNGESSSSMEVAGYTGDNSELTLKNGGIDSSVAKGGSQISAKIAITGLLKVKATPVAGDDAKKVYKAYRDFAKDPGVFRVLGDSKEDPVGAFKWRRELSLSDGNATPTPKLFIVPNTKETREAFGRLVDITSLIRSVPPKSGG